MEKKQVRVGFGVMILKDGKILLGRRHDDPEKADSELNGEGTWTMPGGKMEYGETFEEACCREVLEETGLKIEGNKLSLVSVANDVGAKAQFVTLGFICCEFKGEPKVMEPDEITEWNWFGFDLPDRVFPPSKKLLENYLNKKIY